MRLGWEQRDKWKAIKDKAIGTEYLRAFFSLRSPLLRIRKKWLAEWNAINSGVGKFLSCSVTIHITFFCRLVPGSANLLVRRDARPATQQDTAAIAKWTIQLSTTEWLINLDVTLALLLNLHLAVFSWAASGATEASLKTAIPWLTPQCPSSAMHLVIWMERENESYDTIWHTNSKQFMYWKEREGEKHDALFRDHLSAMDFCADQV